MKSPTKHYKFLKSSLKKARKITSRVDPLYCNTELQSLKVQSYILIGHSALEKYIENIGHEAAITARKLFKEKGIITKTLICLITSKVLNEITEVNKKKISQGVANNIGITSELACTLYISSLATNNGIKSENLKNVFHPVGIDPEDIDTSLMNAMDGFGTKRGNIAHEFKIKRNHTLNEIDQDLNLIETGILAFDAAICDALNIGMKAF